MDPLWSETWCSTFKYFIILIVSTNYILCICWIIKCLTVIDERCKHEKNAHNSVKLLALRRTSNQASFAGWISQVLASRTRWDVLWTLNRQRQQECDGKTNTVFRSVGEISASPFYYRDKNVSQHLRGQIWNLLLRHIFSRISKPMSSFWVPEIITTEENRRWCSAATTVERATEVICRGGGKGVPHQRSFPCLIKEPVCCYGALAK